jgi:hypothetical protein
MGNRQLSIRTTVNEDGAALLDIRSGELTTVNSTGAYIWQALEQGNSAETIAADLARITGEGLSIVEQGVAAFLTELKEHHLWSC